MTFSIEQLKDQLYFIRWEAMPSLDSSYQCAADMKKLLNKQQHLAYIVTDVRKGFITDIRVLRQLGELTNHPNYGGSLTYSTELASDIFGQAFERLSGGARNSEVQRTPEEVRQRLEKLKQGLAEGVDWEALLA